MPVLVDTYNVLHVTGVLPPELAGVDLAELGDLILNSRYQSDVVFLICDGVNTQERWRGTHGVRVRYAGHGKLADDLIARLIDESSAPRRLTVVSSDRQVQRAARRRRCRVIDSARFLATLAEDAHGRASANPLPDKHPTPGGWEVSAAGWLDAFGVDDPDQLLADLDDKAVLPDQLSRHRATDDAIETPAAQPDQHATHTAPAEERTAPEPRSETPRQPPILPLDIVLEAHRMLNEHNTSGSEAQSAPPPDDREAIPKATPDPVAPSISHADQSGVSPDDTPTADGPPESEDILPDDLVAEAERLLQELTSFNPESDPPG